MGSGEEYSVLGKVSGIAARIKNIDGKVMGSDGKPLIPRKRVGFVEYVSNMASIQIQGDKVSMANDSNIALGLHSTSTVSSKEVQLVVEEDGNNLERRFGDGNVVTNEGLGTPFVVPVADLNVKLDSNSLTDENKSGNPSVKCSSFANIVSSAQKVHKVNFRALVNEVCVVNHDTMLPMDAMKKVLSRYDNTLVGYFLGKSIAFPLVQNYVTNTWGKFGLQKLMKNGDGVFLFKFATKDGVGRVLERGPWLIRNSPIILNKWSPTLSLNRDEVTKVPVWIKLHKVPLVAYSEDGLSLIATQVGKPIMLDAFTSSMCVDSWGRISFARALVELSSDSELKSQVTLAIPKEDGSGYITEIINVEYEWIPPHCGDCKSFGHSLIDCPKCIRETVRNDIKVAVMEENDKGFSEVKNRRNKGKKVADLSRPIGGVRLNKPKPNFWRPKMTDHKAQMVSASSNADSGKNLKFSNSFDVLASLGEEAVDGLQQVGRSQDQLVSDLKEKVQDVASKPCTPSSPNAPSKVSNPFSKVGNMVDSDSEVDEVFDDRGDGNNYDDDPFEDIGLSPAQLKGVGLQDFSLS